MLSLSAYIHVVTNKRVTYMANIGQEPFSQGSAMTLGAGDMPALLKKAMPLLPWRAMGGDTALPYCEFLSLLLGVMWVDTNGVNSSLSGFIVADSALHRVWTKGSRISCGRRKPGGLSSSR